MGRFLDLFTPAAQVGHICELDLDWLQRAGVRALLLDLDNTLLAWNHLVLSDEVVDWVQEVLRRGFSICLVSNAPRLRLEVQSVVLGVPMVPSAMKPRRRALRRAMRMLGVTSRETCMIGDQVFTDVLAGNRLGMLTVLVVPLHLQEQWWMHWVRKLERWLVGILQGRHPHPSLGLNEDDGR